MTSEALPVECWECGILETDLDNKQHVPHHPVSRRFGGKRTILLCQDCHELAHATTSGALLAEFGKESIARFRELFQTDHRQLRKECRKHGFYVFNELEIEEILRNVEATRAHLISASDELEYRGFDQSWRVRHAEQDLERLSNLLRKNRPL